MSRLQGVLEVLGLQEVLADLDVLGGSCLSCPKNKIPKTRVSY